MTHLEEKHPWHHAFLQWHKARCRELYLGKGNGMAHAYVELTSKAKDWVVRDLK